MKIKSLVIENFKSIERIELIEPNPFTVFVGPNGSGKSNIFEALEFVNAMGNAPEIAANLFGGIDLLRNRQKGDSNFICKVDFGDFKIDKITDFSLAREKFKFGTRLNFDSLPGPDIYNKPAYQQFFVSFSRIFIKNERILKFKFADSFRLSLSAENLEKVLKRILTDPILKDEIFGWLELFVPGFKAVEVDDRDELHWFEQSSPEHFTKGLISDGTYNILALLTAVYQSDKPQFLCIEEPENGLHPQVAAEFVNVCRYVCEEFGHFIWLNTHSESIVRRLTKEEIVLVDKRDGATRLKQVGHRNFYDLQMDEAWLTGALGGGLPW